MLKMTIDNEEVVSDKDITINEEMLSASSTILNNVYPKEWEEDKDYTSRFYYPQDYSKALLQRSYVTQEAEGGTTIQVNGSATLTDVDTTKNSRVLRLLGQTSQSGTPTPSSPIPVNVVSGDNEINVCGKNLFDSSTFSLKTYSGTNNSARCCQSQAVPLKAGRYVFTTNLDLSVYDYKCDVLREPPQTVSTETYIINSGFITNVNTWTLNLSQAQEGYLGILIRKKDNTNLDLETIKGFQFQLEKTSATNYEPYIGNTYNIDLPSGMELCKIGNYQDYIYKDSDKWYLHKEINKVVLNGTESWGKSGASTSSIFVGSTDITNAIDGNGLSNLFTYSSQVGVGFFTIYNNGANLRLCVDNNTISTIEAFKTWLTSNNVVVYYVLSTPTNTEITDTTLINQLNALSSQ